MGKLKKELEQKKATEFKLYSSILHGLPDSETLLLPSKRDDADILYGLDMTNVNIEEEIKIKVFNETKLSEKRYKSDTYTGEQIKNICTKYGLQILKTRKYGGKIPDDFTEKIRKFTTENKVTLSSEDFFILAPEAAFNEDNYKGNNLTLFYRQATGSSSRMNKIKKHDVLVEVGDWAGDYGLLRQLSLLFNIHKSGNENEYFVFGCVLFILTLLCFMCGVGFFFLFFTLTLSIFFFILSYKNKSNYYKNKKSKWNEVSY